MNPSRKGVLTGIRRVLLVVEAHLLKVFRCVNRLDMDTRLQNHFLDLVLLILDVFGNTHAAPPNYPAVSYQPCFKPMAFKLAVQALRLMP